MAKYQIEYRKDNQAWCVYRKVENTYRAISPHLLPKLKIHGKTISALEKRVLRDVEKISNKIRAKFSVVEED